MIKCVKVNKLIYPTTLKQTKMKGFQHDNLETVPNNPAEKYPPVTNGVRKKTAVAPGVNNKVTGGFEGITNPYLTNRLQYSHPRMVLTVDNGDAENSTGYWIWDEDGNKFVKYDIPVEAQPLYKCSYCQKSFRGSRALSNHLVSHSLEGASVEKSGSEEVAATTTATDPTAAVSSNTGNSNGITAESKSFLNSDNGSDSIPVQSQSSDNDCAKEPQKVQSIFKSKRPGWTNERKGRRLPANKTARSSTESSAAVPNPKSPVRIPEAIKKSAEENANNGKLNLSKALGNDNNETVLSAPDSALEPKTGEDISKVRKVPGETSSTTGGRKRKISPESTGKKRDSKPRGLKSARTGPLPITIPGITENIEVIWENDKGKPRVKCKLCEKAFSSRHSATRHIQSLHLGTKPYPCPICSKAFSLPQILKHHMLIHSGIRPYKCQICPKEFFQKFNLTIHLRIHSGTKPYKCNLCEMAFYQRYALKNHQRRHGEKTDEAVAEGQGSLGDAFTFI